MTSSRDRRRFVLWVVLATATVIPSLPSGKVATAAWPQFVLRWSMQPTLLVGGTPVLPPPASHLHLLPRFFDLLESYVALDAGDKIPFAAWVVLNGITDPRMIDGMVTLYEWYHRALRGA